MIVPAAPPARTALSAAEAEILIETLSARLLSGDSATAVLEDWCGERGLAPEPRLVARRLEGLEPALTEVQSLRLRLRAGEVVRYRHVRLSCGAHTLSEAENWYVPARLTPEMNRLLEATEAPFGRVVHTLTPTRRNLRVHRLWPEAAGIPGPIDRVFSIQAILSDRSGNPICEVSETYTGAILAQGEG